MAVENTINVHVGSGKVLKFEEVELGLYLLSSDMCINENVTVFSFLALVRTNKENFTNIQVKRVDAAREFQKYISYMGYKKYFKQLETSYLCYYLLTVDHTKRVLYIYPPNVGDLKGKWLEANQNK